MSNSKQKMQDIIEARSTSQLLEMMEKLEAAESTSNTRIVSAMISDSLVVRLDIDEALDEVFSDMSFDGSFLDAIKQCIS